MAAVEILDLTPGVSFVKAPTAIGVVRNGKRVALVDTGLDENLVRKVLNRLVDEGATVEAIVNTHAHADHFGGNAFAVARTRAEVWAPAAERAFMEHPTLEPHTLYGAHPPTGLATKWLKAAASPVHHAVALGEKPVEAEIVGLRFRFHAMPGHSPDQAAVEVGGACFLGDALLPEATLAKYGLPFAVDPGEQRESARRVAQLGHLAFQTYHGGAVASVAGLVAANVAAIDLVQERLLAILADGPASTEDAFARLAATYGWSLSLEQYHLNLAATRAHLARLEREGKVALAVEGARLLWRVP